MTVSGFPFHIHRILQNFPVQTGCLSSFPEEQSSDVPDYSFGHLLSGSISAVPAREYRFDPENKTFIWNRWINLRAVDGMAVYQKNVPWFQLISFSFYMISSLAGDEDNYLVKIMIMVREFLSGLVFKMKKSELFVQVSCFSV